MKRARLFALWAGDLTALHAFLQRAGAKASSTCVVVRLPGASADQICAAVAAAEGPVSAADALLGVNLGGPERGCSVDELIASLGVYRADWFQVPERCAPLPATPGTAQLRSCHSLAGVDVALSSGAQAVTLSPIWSTDSKPDAKPLGLSHFQRACAAWPGRVVALGGIGPSRLREVAAVGGVAVAALSAPWASDGSDMMTEIGLFPGVVGAVKSPNAGADCPP
ncbi:MAG: thiamine phosphate synthase [Myxococcales bacterium]|nr:thiamine phosphate synthase [Myxococcales bacterium]